MEKGKLFRITIYLKGNSVPIVLQGVDIFTWKKSGNIIESLEWEIDVKYPQLKYVCLAEIALILSEEM